MYELIFFTILASSVIIFLAILLLYLFKFL